MSGDRVLGVGCMVEGRGLRIQSAAAEVREGGDLKAIHDKRGAILDHSTLGKCRLYSGRRGS